MIASINYAIIRYDSVIILGDSNPLIPGGNKKVTFLLPPGIKWLT